MKSFIFTTKRRNHKYGGENVVAKIYRIKRNVPVYLGEVKYCTASMRGEDHEVNNWLIQNKHLPKTYQNGSGYINWDLFNKKYTIKQL